MYVYSLLLLGKTLDLYGDKESGNGYFKLDDRIIHPEREIPFGNNYFLYRSWTDREYNKVEYVYQDKVWAANSHYEETSVESLVGYMRISSNKYTARVDDKIYDLKVPVEIPYPSDKGVVIVLDGESVVTELEYIKIT